MSARGPIANRPHGLTIRRPWRWLLWLLTVLIAGVIGWLIHGNRTVTHTNTVTELAPPANVYQDTQAGLVAAAQQYFAQDATTCLSRQYCAPPNAWSLGIDGGGGWSLGYRITSYAPRAATILAWQLSVLNGGGATVNGTPPASVLSWGTTTVPFIWNGTRWQQHGVATTSAAGPTPPPDGTTGSASQAFASQMRAWTRFPGAP